VTSGARFLLVRHGRTTYNDEGRLNGDPSVPVALTARGRAQVEALAERLADEPFDMAARSRFPRAAATLGILLRGRDVPVRVLPDLDDVRLGVLEGHPVGDYREWRRRNGMDHAPPGGESRLEVLARYRRAFEELLDVGARDMLVVTHDVPIRFLLNAREGADPLDGPIASVANATPYRLTADEIRAGLAVMRERLDSEGRWNPPAGRD
jgi:broad specificity phosphatase PhoE